MCTLHAGTCFLGTCFQHCVVLRVGAPPVDLGDRTVNEHFFEQMNGTARCTGFFLTDERHRMQYRARNMMRSAHEHLASRHGIWSTALYSGEIEPRRPEVTLEPPRIFAWHANMVGTARRSCYPSWAHIRTHVVGTCIPPHGFMQQSLPSASVHTCVRWLRWDVLKHRARSMIESTCVHPAHRHMLPWHCAGLRGDLTPLT